MKGIGFDATCSLAVLSQDTDKPISVCGPDFTDHKRNVICEKGSRMIGELQTDEIQSVDGSCNAATYTLHFMNSR